MRLTAPPPEPALILADGLLAALGERMRSRRGVLLWGPPYVAVGLGLVAVRTRAERRRARGLGLTALTAAGGATGA